MSRHFVWQKCWAFVCCLAILSGSLAACAAPSSQTATEGAAESAAETADEAAESAAVNLNFVVWSYSIETIQDNIAQFEAQNPGITVSLADFSWFDYHDILATRFTGNTPTEVAYSSDHWLQEWVAAGWIVPIDEQCPNIGAYVDEFAPYAVEGMTAEGKLYGLPYYADLVTFMYNADIAEQAGVTSAPETWEQLTEHAQTIKDAGLVQYPIAIPLKKDDPWTVEIFYAMVYSRGGQMFDAENNPVFNQPGSPAEQTLQWLYDAVHTHQVIDPAVLEVAEPDVVKTMGAGQHVYTVLAKYNLAELNGAAHEQAGNFRLALMPGETHSTVGFVRFYALTRDAVAGGQATIDAACRFLEYFGGRTDGEYRVVKRWALEKGLGFAQMPLYDDPEVAETINAWGDVELERQQAELARIKEGLTPWWGAWDVFARQQIHNAVLGEITPQEALQSMADTWEELRADFE